MPSFREIRMRYRIDGFQCHHLIPTQLIEKRAFSKLFESLGVLGFDSQDFETNGMHLPCTEKTALAFQKPMHRGPHPHYNQVVADHISPLTSMPVGNAYGQIRILQRQLRQGLRRDHMLCRNDAPMLSGRLRILEEEAAALYGLLNDALKQ